MSRFILITGGARSGKSRFAELLARQPGLPVTYMATAQIWDPEMANRVDKHRLNRPLEWSLIEEPYKITQALLKLPNENSIVLLDCITLWLSNLLLSHLPSPMAREQPAPASEKIATPGTPGDLTGEASYDQSWEKDAGLRNQIEMRILEEVYELADAAVKIKPKVIFVTNEVGQGIVPENPLGRLYRDLAGKANQILAEAAEEVYLVVAGYPLEIKHKGQRLLASFQTLGG
ncbi:MAG: bifunctional adenosylcobinamide kinase/adenosylcobinamide-phosphate guanylyltransferase [Desulfitobacteriaceae bacterium]